MGKDTDAGMHCDKDMIDGKRKFCNRQTTTTTTTTQTPGRYMTDFGSQRNCTSVCVALGLECSDDSSVIDSADEISAVAASLNFSCTSFTGPWAGPYSPSANVDVAATYGKCNYKDTDAGMHCDTDMIDGKRKFCNCQPSA